jgi:hypothetical protein
MASEPEQPPQETPAPSLGLRMVWWFGIYLTAAGFFEYDLFKTSPPPDPVLPYDHLLPLYLFPLFVSTVPLGLVVAYESIFNWILSLVGLTNFPDIFYDVFCLPSAYATYVVHLMLTRKARTRREFLFLMLSLVLFVSAWHVMRMFHHF